VSHVQAAAGAHDHEDVNMETLGKSSGFDKNAQPQIAGNLVPPSESKAANGESDTVRFLITAEKALDHACALHEVVSAEVYCHVNVEYTCLFTCLQPAQKSGVMQAILLQCSML